MPEFDAYLMVDWSARNERKTGEDSIWYCMRTRQPHHSECLSNPSTREEAAKQIAALLRRNVTRQLHTLVGFDFPYAYPAGFACRLGLKDQPSPLWRQVWSVLLRLVEDDERNQNNRFQVAAVLNKAVSGRNYPFWGCPPNSECATLSPRETSGDLQKKRITERRIASAQSPWKLLGRGSVGSQSIVGIPYLARLREHVELARHSRVWPFETGLKELPSRDKRRWLILHAEIYPAVIKYTARKGEVRDAEQVRALARHFARLDEKGELSRFFEGPPDLSDKDRRTVENEEGWILGV